MEAKIEAKPGILHMTVQITRKATGKVEEYQLTGTALPEDVDKLTTECQTDEALSSHQDKPDVPPEA